MKRLLTRSLSMIAVTALFAASLSAETKYFSYAFDKAFRVTITDAAIANSPPWKEDSESPPLSARKALRLANELKDSLVEDSDKYKWKLRSLALHPAEGLKWYWLATYAAESRHSSTGPSIELRLVVLMDGTAIKPEIGGNSDG